MNIRKLVTIVSSLIGGTVVISVGLVMLPLHLAVPWVFFNIWLWIVAPVSLLWAAHREDQKRTTQS